MDNDGGDGASRKTTAAIEKKKFSVEDFIDLKKTCDTFHHNQLMRNLDRSEGHQTAYKWINNDLDNRHQLGQ